MSVVFARTHPYPRHQRLDLYAGDEVEFTLTAEEELTGEVVAEIRRSRSDPDALATFQVSLEGNVATLKLDGDQTAELGSFVGFYDVQWISDGLEAVTLIQGSVFCALDVSKPGGAIPPGPFEPGYPITEISFPVDGPLADPWLPSLAIYPGSPPVALAGNILLEESSEGQTAAVGRPDLELSQLVGIRASNAWDANPWASGMRLFLIAASGLEWYELYFTWTGTELNAAAWRVNDGGEDGPVYTDLIPSHTPDLPLGFPPGAALAFQLDPATLTLRYLVSADGSTLGLAELGASTGQTTLVGPFTPALAILGDAEATGFFSGGPPED